MAARVSSTSSEEMTSSSEDSASEDPINIAKGRGQIQKRLRFIIVNTNANMTVIKFVNIFK